MRQQPSTRLEQELELERMMAMQEHEKIVERSTRREGNAALHSWTERRARVEEELTRRSEAIRFAPSPASRRPASTTSSSSPSGVNSCARTASM